jgi:hypothetical protein
MNIAGSLKIVLSLLLLWTGLACSSSGPAVAEQEKPKQEVKKERKAPLAEYEATLRPSDFDEEVEVVQKKHAEEKPRVELDIPRDSSVVEEEILQGFRIQIFSSANIDEATKMKANTQPKLPQDSVYVMYDPPVYKVRIGDFVSRYEAGVKLPLVVEQGYPDAWIVPDRIVQRRYVQVPKPVNR